MKNDEFISIVSRKVAEKNGRSAWSRGVGEYAKDLLTELEMALNDGGITQREAIERSSALKGALLCGAVSWKEYSYGGFSLICNCDIAARLCTPSELKKTKGGERNPNARETWIDVQARALQQAFERVARTIKECYFLCD